VPQVLRPRWRATTFFSSWPKRAVFERQRSPPPPHAPQGTRRLRWFCRGRQCCRRCRAAQRRRRRASDGGTVRRRPRGGGNRAGNEIPARITFARSRCATSKNAAFPRQTSEGSRACPRRASGLHTDCAVVLIPQTQRPSGSGRGSCARRHPRRPMLVGERPSRPDAGMHTPLDAARGIAG